MLSAFKALFMWHVSSRLTTLVLIVWVAAIYADMVPYLDGLCSADGDSEQHPFFADLAERLQQQQSAEQYPEHAQLIADAVRVLTKPRVAPAAADAATRSSSSAHAQQEEKETTAAYALRVDDLYASGYFEARTKFNALGELVHRHAAYLNQIAPGEEKIVAEQRSHLVFRDPVTELSYFTDTIKISLEVRKTAEDDDDAKVKNKKRELLVHTSAVHGVEGYAGTPVQLAFLLDWMLRPTAAEQRRVLRRKTLLLVHAVNPYGYANDRRFNENNVDLNRNSFHTEAEWSAIRARDPNIAGAVTFGEMLSPRFAPVHWLHRYVPFVRALTILPTLLTDFVAVKRAIVAGQYHDPQATFFGGMGLQRGLQVLLDEIVGAEMFDAAAAKGGNPTATRYAKLVAVDVHSGLGPSGVDTLLVMQAEEMVAAAAALAPRSKTSGESDEAYRARVLRDARAQVEEAERRGSDVTVDGYVLQCDSFATSGAAGGYELTQGMVKYNKFATKREGPRGGSYSRGEEEDEGSATHVVNVVEEFGTTAGFLVASAMVYENTAYHYARFSDAHGMWQDKVRDVFFVPTPKWKNSVLQRGAKLLNRLAFG